jgi:predicted TIM-barrel fold metal-dependent hydrolase
MAYSRIIDALFCIPAKDRVVQISDCVPFTQDLAPLMNSSGIAGAILAHGNCAQCEHQWNCADRRTCEVVKAVQRNPKQLSGLASYDSLRIGDSLRWIEEAVTAGGLVGAYTQAECCISGLDAPRMYPLYGLCAKLRVTVVIDFSSQELWAHHRPQAELVAADFPELDIMLATPPRTKATTIIRMMQRFPRISLLLCPQELQSNSVLCEYVDVEGSERVLFRSSSNGWPQAVETARLLPLSPAARRAYLSENAMRLFGLPFEAQRLKA